VVIQRVHLEHLTTARSGGLILFPFLECVLRRFWNGT